MATLLGHRALRFSVTVDKACRATLFKSSTFFGFGQSKSISSRALPGKRGVIGRNFNFVYNSAKLSQLQLLGIKNASYYSSQPEASADVNKTITNDALSTEASFDQPSSIMSQIASNISDTASQTTAAAADTVVHAGTQLGGFKDLGLGNNTPVGWIEQLFELTHMYTGLPWWGTIAVATLAFRMAMFPISALLQKSTIKMQNVQPKLVVIRANLKRAQQDNNQHEYRTQASLMQQVMKKEGINPFSTLLLPLIQMPVMISFFMALRSMSNLPVPGLETGGALWFTNLAAPDPYFALPVIAAAGMISVFEVNRKLQSSIPQSPVMIWGLRGVGVLVAIVTIKFDASIFVYFIVNNFFTIFQTWFMTVPSVRRAFKIPKINKTNLAKPPKNDFVKLVESSMAKYKKSKN